MIIEKITGRSYPEAITFFKARFYLNFATYLFRRLTIGAVFFTLLIYLFTHRELGTDYLGSLSTLYTVQVNLPYTILITAGVVTMFVGISIFFLTLVNSNKIAGPFYRLERLFEEVEKGDLSVVVNFRKDDAINLIVDDSNRALEETNKHFKAVSEASDRLKNNIKILEADPQLSNMEQLYNDLLSLKNENERFKIIGG